MAVLQAMFEAEVTPRTGPEGRHNPERVAVRHVGGKGLVTLDGWRVEARR